MINYCALKINKTNAPVIAALIYQTYRRFNRKEADKRPFFDYLANFDCSIHSSDALAEKFKKLNINFAAFSGEKMVGIIRGRNNRLINLFVAGDFHKQGVGRKLVGLFEHQAKREGSKFIKLRSSLYAVGFYTRLGYKKTTGVRLFHSLKVQPMKKII